MKTLIPALKALADVEIKIGCQNLCGIGRDKSFVIVDHVPIIADNEKELLEKVKEYINTDNKR